MISSGSKFKAFGVGGSCDYMSQLWRTHVVLSGKDVLRIENKYKIY